MIALEGIYCGPAPLPSELWLRWNLDPVPIAGLAALVWLVRGSVAGLAGVFVLAVAFISPLCALSAALFAARAAHHVLLVAVAAPLLALALPASRPVAAGLPFLAATAALWAWHAPAAYDLALGNVAAYWLMQLTLLGTGVWFWRATLSRPAGAGALWVLGAYMAMGLLGALLTFAPVPLYAIHRVAPLDWGLLPLADQQLGGLLMWVPAALPYAVMGLVLGRRSWRAMQAGAA